MSDFAEYRNNLKPNFNATQKESLLAELIHSLCYLPGVGIRSAERMSYYLLGQNQLIKAAELADNLKRAVEKIKPCSVCRNLTELNVCQICTSKKRDEKVLCVVESPINLINIEKTGQFFGKYFVLMGLISPLDGVGARQLGLDLLIEIIVKREITELILAISASVEGQATGYYLKKIAIKYNIKISQLAQGVPVGSELDYIDQKTLAHALSERNQF